MNIGYRFIQTKAGAANGQFCGIGADESNVCVKVDAIQPMGLLISNGQFVCMHGETRVPILVESTCQGSVRLVNCSFWGPIDRCVWMRAPAGQFTASACHFVDWDNRGAGSPAIQLDAGKAIVQGSTFQRPKLHVAVGSNVVSAILTANQAEGGFRIRNLAGKKTQSALNEEDQIDWPKGSVLNYVINVGRRGDGRYLEGWHDAENGPPPFRWSGTAARLRLPVVAGERYTLTLQVSVPEHARAPAAGLHVAGKQVAPLEASSELAAKLGPATEDYVEVELRCQGWVPSRVVAGSGDPRTLGVQLMKITMRAESAATNRVFDANVGKWLPTE